MKINFVVLCLAGLATANAGAAENKEFVSGQSGVTASISLGQLGGRWTVKGSDGSKDKTSLTAPVIKGDIAWDATDQLTLNAKGYTTLSSGKGKQDKLTNTNTRLEYAREFDLNLKAWALKEENYRFGGVIGYQQTRTHLLERSNPGASAFRLDMSQKLSLPYLGLAGMYRYQDFELNAVAKFSPWAKSHNQANSSRNFVWEHEGRNSKYYAATLNAGYYITPNTKLFAEVDWAKLADKKIANDGGATLGYLGYTQHTVSLGLQYRF